MTDTIDRPSDIAAPVAADQISRALPWIRDPRWSFEIRVLRVHPEPTTVRQFGPGATDREIIDFVISQEGPDVTGIYFGANPRKSGLRSSQAGSKGFIERRRIYAIDVDAGNPRDTNCTEEERTDAWGVTQAIKDHVHLSAGKHPVINSSGNGYHLLFRIDEEDDGEDGRITAAIQKSLRRLAAKFNRGTVKVDLKVFDSPRILRLVGTWNRKAAEGPDRPHRYAEIVELPPCPPDEWEPLSIEEIENLAAGYPDAPPVATPRADPPDANREPYKPPLSSKPFTGKMTCTDGRLSNIERASRYAARCDGAIGDKGLDGSGKTIYVACQVGCGFDLTEEECLQVLADHWNPRCDPPWDIDGNHGQTLRRKVSEAYKREHRRGYLLDNDAPPRMTYKSLGPAPGAIADPSIPEGPGVSDSSKEDGRPVINLGDGDDLSAFIDIGIPLLGERPEIFERGNFLVRVLGGDEGQDGKITKLDSSPPPKIEPLVSVSIQEELSRAAKWVRPTKNGLFRSVDPPWNMVEAIRVKGRWPGVRRLNFVTDTPVLLMNGKVCTEPGYDPESKVLYRPARQYPPVPEFPTRDDALAALEKLLFVVQDFPFATEGDRSAWLAHPFTIVARAGIDGPTPLFLTDGNVRGTGKSKLNEAGMLIGTGRIPEADPVPYEIEETRKFITALGLRGARVVHFDNIDVEKRFGNGPIDSALTTTKWRDRILGQSKQEEVPLHVVWSANGNNVQIKGDLSRRIIRCRLESPLERPETRDPQKFAIPEFDRYIMENQAELLVAALTILRAYVVAGYPRVPGTPRMGSYEAFDRLVRGAILWLGLADPLTSAEEAMDEDPLVMMGRALVAGLTEMPQVIWGRGMTAKEILQELGDAPDKYEELRTAMLTYIPGRNESLPTPQTLAGALVKIKGRNIGGMEVRNKKGNAGYQMWFLQRQSNSPSEIVTSSEAFPGDARGRLDFECPKKEVGGARPEKASSDLTISLGRTSLPGQSVAWDDPYDLEERAATLQFDGRGMQPEAAMKHAQKQTGPAKAGQRRACPDGPNF